jgi:hypothetical protein
MMGTIVVAACIAPFFLFGLAFASFVPILTTGLGVGWAWFTYRRRATDEKDPTLAYYDSNWKDYVSARELFQRSIRAR